MIQKQIKMQQSNQTTINSQNYQNSKNKAKHKRTHYEKRIKIFDVLAKKKQ